MRTPNAALLIAVMSWAAPATAQPAITAVLNGASFQTGIPRGCLVSIFGTKLAPSTATAGTLPLPKKLAGVVVTVGALEIEAPLYYVSPGQINAQIPFEALGDTLPLFVTTAEGKSQPFLLPVAVAGPGIFTRSGDGRGAALIFDTDFQPLAGATAGKPMILYATGLGPTDPPALSGSPAATTEPLNRVVNVPEVFMGEAPARVDFAGLAPGLAGVYQLNVVPQQLATDRLYIRSQGRSSNVASVASLSGGRNTANATGSIQALYPTADPAAPPVAYSPMLLAAKFTASLDILPSAGPFVIAAVSDAATSIITVDPANSTFEGTVTLPTMASRVGDFSGAEFQVIDLFTCHGVPIVCFPAPGNVLPASRISAWEVMALTDIPLPETLNGRSSTGVTRVQGSVRPGTTFVIDDKNNASLSVFAGYLSFPVPSKATGTTTLRLYIDGRLVASTDVTYRLPGFLERQDAK
jgi:uncharacterized protein (TIGR03437 family)